MKKLLSLITIIILSMSFSVFAAEGDELRPWDEGYVPDVADVRPSEDVAAVPVSTDVSVTNSDIFFINDVAYVYGDDGNIYSNDIYVGYVDIVGGTDVVVFTSAGFDDSVLGNTYVIGDSGIIAEYGTDSNGNYITTANGGRLYVDETTLTTDGTEIIVESISGQEYSIVNGQVSETFVSQIGGFYDFLSQIPSYSGLSRFFQSDSLNLLDNLQDFLGDGLLSQVFIGGTDGVAGALAQDYCWLGNADATGPGYASPSNINNPTSITVGGVQYTFTNYTSQENPIYYMYKFNYAITFGCSMQFSIVAYDSNGAERNLYSGSFSREAGSDPFVAQGDSADIRVSSTDYTTICVVINEIDPIDYQTRQSCLIGNPDRICNVIQSEESVSTQYYLSLLEDDEEDDETTEEGDPIQSDI